MTQLREKRMFLNAKWMDVNGGVLPDLYHYERIDIYAFCHQFVTIPTGPNPAISEQGGKNDTISGYSDKISTWLRLQPPFGFGPEYQKLHSLDMCLDRGSY